MKNALKLGFLGLMAIFLIISCTDDLGTGGGGTGGGGTGGTGGGGGTVEGAPDIFLIQSDGLVSSDVVLKPGDSFDIQLRATKGDADLKAVFFEVDGAAFPNNALDVIIDGELAPGAGVEVRAEETAELLWNVTLPAHDDISTKVYSFIIQDVANNEDQVNIQVTTEEEVVEVIAPTINLPGGNNIPLMAGGLAKINLNVVAGTPALDQIAVFEIDMNGDPQLITDLTRLDFGDLDFTDNPMLLEGADRNGFEKPLYIRAQSNESETTYVIVLIDEAGNNYTSDLILNTVPAGNPVTNLRGVLFNSAGPSGTGGLDLQSGAGLGSADPEADIKDNGIDTGQSNDNNWLQTISGVNGTEIRALIPDVGGLPETFNFEDVTTDLTIENVWGSAQALGNTNLNGESSTDAVSVGDTFVALKDGTYYLFVIREVNVNPMDNSDNYVLDIKF